MDDFYSEMADMASELLSPTSQGGLGQGELILTRSIPGVPDPSAPWIPVQPTYQSEVLKGAARGVEARLVGVETGGTIILASDRQVICATPVMSYTAGDVLSIDGNPVHIIAVEKIPAAGTTVAVKFIIRG